MSYFARCLWGGRKFATRNPTRKQGAASATVRKVGLASAAPRHLPLLARNTIYGGRTVSSMMQVNLGVPKGKKATCPRQSLLEESMAQKGKLVGFYFAHMNRVDVANRWGPNAGRSASCNVRFEIVRQVPRQR